LVAHVLIADDDPDVRMLLRSVLQLRGWTVTEATNGFEALRLVREDDFDVVVLDHAMPEMNGFEAARHARMSYAGPIVFYSAYVTPSFDEEIRATIPGDVHLVSKTDFIGFLAVLEQLLAA
jgi:CheY-like chemotaxis protein